MRPQGGTKSASKSFKMSPRALQESPRAPRWLKGTSKSSKTLFCSDLALQSRAPQAPRTSKILVKMENIFSHNRANSSQTLPRCSQERPRPLQTPLGQLQMVPRHLQEPSKSLQDTSKKGSLSQLASIRGSRKLQEAPKA